MYNDRLINTTAESLATYTGCNASKIDIPPETIRKYLIDLFKCLNVGDVGKELEPIHDAFVILGLAEKYMIEPPVKEWIEEPPENWTWEMCVQEAYYDYFSNKNRSLNINGQRVENKELEDGK